MARFLSWLIMGVGLPLMTACTSLPSSVQAFNTTHYLASVDTRSLLPPAMYRMRVEGYAGWPLPVSFATAFLDRRALREMRCLRALSGLETEPAGAWPGITTSFLFGPEGLRQLPRNHELVVVIGDVHRFFRLWDSLLEETLGLPIPGADRALSLEQAQVRNLHDYLARLMEQRE